MSNHRICDNCRYYYQYGLTQGVCMLFLLTGSGPLDKNVNYNDTCNDWVANDDPKQWKLIRDSYLSEKERYANLKRKSKEKSGLL